MHPVYVKGIVAKLGLLCIEEDVTTLCKVSTNEWKGTCQVHAPCMYNSVTLCTHQLCYVYQL